MKKLKYDFLKFLLLYLEIIILFSIGQDQLFALYIIYNEAKWKVAEMTVTSCVPWK